jgi:hypothetical protein
MGQFVDYRNDKEGKGKKTMKIEINGKQPDNATLERITIELIEKGWLSKALKLSAYEKGIRAIAILLTIGGFFYATMLEVAICLWILSFLESIGLELHMRKIRKFCEDNS